MSELAEPLQARHDTCRNRYPEAMARLLKRAPEARSILSFGCSTGDECLDLAEAFPRARVVGVDANPGVLDAARSLSHHKRVRYATPADADMGAPYDLITCHSVLCHHPAARDLPVNTLWSFVKFSETVAALDALLAEGGWLSILNAEYEFTATRMCADRYRVDSAKLKPLVRVFDTRNTTTTRGTKALPFLFQKLQW